MDKETNPAKDLDAEEQEELVKISKKVQAVLCYSTTGGFFSFGTISLLNGLPSYIAVVNFILSGLSFFAQTKIKPISKLRSDVGDILDNIFDDLNNFLFYRPTKRGKAINYLSSKRIDPNVSCVDRGIDPKYNVCCSNSKCSFGPGIEMTLSEEDIYQISNKRIDIRNVRGLNPKFMNILVSLNDNRSKLKRQQECVVVRGNLKSWSLTKCVFKLWREQIEISFSGTVQGFLIVPNLPFLPMYWMIDVKISKKEDELHLSFNPQISRRDYKLKKRALTCRKIIENEQLQSQLFFC